MGKDQRKKIINGLHHFIFLIKLIKLIKKKKVLSIFIYQSYFDLQKNKKKFNNLSIFHRIDQKLIRFSQMTLLQTSSGLTPIYYTTRAKGELL
jgi:hypothetical protein